jgi:hypothetical protein
MIFPKSSLRFLLVLLLPAVVAAQSGGLAGSVVADDTGEPIPYAVIGITRGGSFFTNDAGKFVVSGLAPGTIELQIKHPGYIETSFSVTIAASRVDTIDIRLVRLAVKLDAVATRSWPACLTPGPPPVARDSTLARILDQMRLNAGQFRLLAQEYPFVYTMDIERSRLLRRNKKVVVDETTQSVIKGEGADSYTPGHVLARVGMDWLFTIPTLSQLGDSSFLTTHCFHFGGTEPLNDSTVIRVDVVASARISEPDVNGSIYLDPVTFQVRRTALSLSKIPVQYENIQSMDIVTDFREILPGIAVIGHVLLTQTVKPKFTGKYDELYETQDLIGMKFLRAIPGRDALTRGKPDK